MSRRPGREDEPDHDAHKGKLIAGIFDVDGVLLASPHERARRESLEGLADPKRFTTALYQDLVDEVVESLDEVARVDLAHGQLHRRAG